MATREVQFGAYNIYIYMESFIMDGTWWDTDHALEALRFWFGR